MVRVLGLVLLGALVGCAADVPDEARGGEQTGTTSQAIINGTASPETQNAVIQLALDKGTGPESLCTGTMVAKNLVLTARHCVGQVNDAQTAVTNFSPTWLRVYVGQSSPQKIVARQAPAAIGKKIFSSSTSSMFPDIALVLLDRPIENPIAKIRIDGGAKVDEPLTIVGYGLQANGTEPSVRMQRTGKKVLQTYPAEVEGEALNPGEFTFSEAACSGDSGGPALSATTGAVIGVASRVGNGTEPTQANPASFCLGANALDFYTALSASKPFLTTAFKEAGASPLLETSTAEPDDDDESTTRTRAKTSSDEDDEDEDKPKATKRTALPTTSSGCSASPSGRADGALALVGVALALGAASRRRRSP